MSLPPVPIYNIPAVLKLRDRLEDTLLPYCGTAPTGGEFDDFVTHLVATLSRVSWETAWNSVQYLAGTQLTNDVLQEMSWRLAGNLPLLQAGYAVGPWVSQPGPEWVPAHITGSLPWRRGRGRGFAYTLRILAGLSCPLTIEKRYPFGYIMALARRMGFGNRRRGYPLQHGSELVNLRLMALIEPGFCRPGQPDFEHVHVSAGQRTWNREVIQRRQRIDFACPMSYTHPCYRCWVGYEDCPAGCHQRTFEKRFCAVCNKESLFDPLYGDSRCVVCREVND